MPIPANPALLINGPAYIQTRNKAFYSKGNISVLAKRTVFQLELNSVGAVEDRELDFSYEIKFTPVGRLDALSVLWPYGIVAPGELLHAVTDIVSVVTGTDVITFVSLARFRDGAPIVPATFGTLPAGITAQVYFLHKLSATTGTLHTTEVAALAGTSPVDITAAGTGLSRIIEQEYVKIITPAGVQYQFWNTALPQSPDINATGAATAIGEVTIEAFRAFAKVPTDAASFYTRTTGVTQDTSFDPSAILTETYNLSWGATAPWAAMNTRDGIKVSFPMETSPIGDDASGLATRRIESMDALATCKPIGISEDDVQAKHVSQGAGAGRGRRIWDANNLLIQGTTPIYIQLYGAVLVPTPINYDRKEDRVAELSWKPTRSFAAGVPKPLYFVGGTTPP